MNDREMNKRIVCGLIHAPDATGHYVTLNRHAIISTSCTQSSEVMISTKRKNRNKRKEIRRKIIHNHFRQTGGRAASLTLFQHGHYDAMAFFSL